MRCLGIDLGEARTGLALSDPHGVTCSPLEVIRERDVDALLQKIVAVASEYEVDCVVVGLPRPLGGGTNRQVEKVLAFVSALSDASEKQVETWDERFTSRMAEAGRKPGDAHDAIAACYMLQNYLDARASERGEP